MLFLWAVVLCTALCTGCVFVCTYTARRVLRQEHRVHELRAEQIIIRGELAALEQRQRKLTGALYGRTGGRPPVTINREGDEIEIPDEDFDDLLSFQNAK